jgi:hypothetical protein
VFTNNPAFHRRHQAPRYANWSGCRSIGAPGRTGEERFVRVLTSKPRVTRLRAMALPV